MLYIMHLTDIFNKQAVAHRLALAARKSIYGEAALVVDGPIPIKITVSGKDLLVTYNASRGANGKGIVLRSSYGFDVTVASGSTWIKVNASANTKTTVTLTLPSTIAAADVTRVRYAFEDKYSTFFGTGPAVFNGEGIPATPYLGTISK